MRYKPRARPTDRSELSGQLIMNAAFVAYETQKARAQNEWLEACKRRRVIYVFDTDLVTTWCAPWRSGPVDPVTLGNGYGQVLPQKIIAEVEPNERQKFLDIESTQAEAIAWLLASRALGAALRAGVPLLLTESHFGEAMTVYQQVKHWAERYDDVTKKGVDARLDTQLATALRAVRSNLDKSTTGTFNARNAGAIIAGILRLIDLRDATRTHGSVREWDAFRDIVRIGNGIFKLSEYRPDGKNIDGETLEKWTALCEAGARGEGDTEIDELKKIFLPPIERAKNSRRSEQSEIDAKSVAEVAYLNHRLREESVALRVVLMTGDRGMALAMANERKAMLPGVGSTVSNFAFDHVRHLWSFVDLVEHDANMPPKDGKAPANPEELFSGLLAFEDEREKSEDFRRFLLDNAVEPDPAYVRRIGEGEIHDAYERWERYTEQASDIQKHYLFDNLKRERISEIIIGKFNSCGAAMDGAKLLAIVRETTARVRDRANVEFSGIGANSLLDQHKNGIRNPPDLMFDSLWITDGIFKDLALPERVFVTVEDFAVRFDQIVHDCHQPDPDNTADDDFRQECYLKYIVLGALFASANRWIVAEQHAESAVRIIERARELNDPIRIKQTGTGEPRSHMSGREGYFLLASSKRVRARTDRRFEEAQKALEKARERLHEDRQKETALGVPFIRFNAEELAISLGRYYSSREKAARNAPAATPTEYDPCDDRVDEIYSFSETLLKAREAMRRADGQPDAPKGDKLAFLQSGTRSTIATNLIQVYVISEFRRSRHYEGKIPNPINREVVSDELNVLIEHSDLLSKLDADGFLRWNGSLGRRARIICSPLMMLYAAVGDLLIGTRKLLLFRSEADVDKIFNRYKASVTHYDDWRYDELRKFAKELVKKDEPN